MNLLRFNVFNAVLEPFSRSMRRRRMAKFVEAMQIEPGVRILDLGGQPEIWDHIDECLKITCVNLSGVAETDHPSRHDIRFYEGDACHLPEFEPGDFDIVFSNSVIEHVGGPERRAQFAAEVRRLSDRYWVQTPSKFFPLEAHCGMPFWWFYPAALRQFFLRRWAKKLPAWTEMVATTDIVERDEMSTLFPDATLFNEWLVVPKSLVAYHQPA